VPKNNCNNCNCNQFLIEIK